LEEEEEDEKVAGLGKEAVAKVGGRAC